MQTEELIFDDCSEREVVEKFSKAFPDIRISVFAAAFVVETIDLCDLPTLMVASENGDSVFVAYFESDE